MLAEHAFAQTVSYRQLDDQIGAECPRWYALYTCVNQEKQVAVRLERQGIEFYLPLYRTLRRRSDRRVVLSLPLFPGYLFVHVSWRERRRVMETPRVVRMIGNGSLPRPVDDEEIETLRRGLSGQVQAEPWRYLTAGRKVRVVNGPFQGFEGILVQRRQGRRLAVTLRAIMRSFLIEVGEADLEPL